MAQSALHGYLHLIVRGNTNERNNMNPECILILFSDLIGIYSVNLYSSSTVIYFIWLFFSEKFVLKLCQYRYAEEIRFHFILMSEIR